MLSDLDKIDWSSLNGAYGPATNVPHMLRAVINAPDYESFRDAYGDFFNEVGHQGGVYQVTSYTVPFLLDLLKDEKNIKRREAYLMTMIEFAKDARIQDHDWGIPLRSSHPPTVYRYALALHDAICEGLNLYLSFLLPPGMGLSGLSMYLLTFLAGHHERVVPPLQEYAQNQKHPHLRAGAIWGIARLWKEAEDGWKHRGRADWFKPFIEHDSDLRVRAVSALAYAQLKSLIHNEWPAFIVKELSDSLAYTLPYDDEAHLGYLYYDEEFLPFEDDWIRAIRRAALSPQLIQLVEQGNGPPRMMHRLIRELLNTSFGRAQPVLWGHIDADPALRGKNNQAILYQPPKGTPVYQPEKKLTEHQQQALKAIVDCDAFWEIPTNLFSFFYSLPDEREALRDLLA